MPFLEQASSFGGSVDSIFLAFFAVSVAVLCGVTFLIVYFTVRYSRTRNPEPVDIEGNLWLEIAWTVVPLVIFLVMFTFGWTSYREMRNPPADSMVIEVTGRQWAWSFKYPNGKQTGELTVALGRPVRLQLSSPDVVHGFYIPAFRIKMDVVPGKTNETWFRPLLLGSFDIQCTVICGVNHTYMLSKVHVLPEDEFKRWYFGRDDTPAPVPSEAPAGGSVLPADPRAALLKAKECLMCHSIDGRPSVGPTFAGLFGSKQVFVEDGKDVEKVIDEALVQKGLEEPGANAMKGYPPVMPKVPLSGEEKKAIVGFLESLGAKRSSGGH